MLIIIPFEACPRVPALLGSVCAAEIDIVFYCLVWQSSCVSHFVILYINGLYSPIFRHITEREVTLTSYKLLTQFKNCIYTILHILWIISYKILYIKYIFPVFNNTGDMNGPIYKQIIWKLGQIFIHSSPTGLQLYSHCHLTRNLYLTKKNDSL